MSAIDVLRSFAEARLEDEYAIENGVTYGHAREIVCLVATLTAERDALEARLKTACEDWSADDSAIRNVLRPVMGDMVDGDEHGVPPLVDLVHWLVAKLASLEHDLALAEQGHSNAH